MKSWFGLATAIATMSGITVDAKRHYTVKEDITTKEHRRP